MVLWLEKAVCKDLGHHTLGHTPAGYVPPGVDDRLARNNREGTMKTFVIERAITGIGASSADALQAISAKSVGVLAAMGPQIQWVHSYVTDDKIYCVYRADDAELVREHARVGGFPADSVAEVASFIDPTTANA